MTAPSTVLAVVSDGPNYRFVAALAGKSGVHAERHPGVDTVLERLDDTVAAVIVEVGRPDGGTPAAIRRIRSVAENLPILYFAASTTDTDVAAACRHLVDGYIRGDRDARLSRIELGRVLGISSEAPRPVDIRWPFRRSEATGGG